MDAGLLRNKITLIEEVVTVTETGFKKSEIKEIGKFRCLAEFLSTREIYRMEKINLKVGIKFTLRNIRKMLNEKQIIIFKDEEYSITYIEEVFDNSNYITVFANKVKGK